MQVNRVQSISFQSKPRFLSPEANNGIKQLLTNMDEESIIISKEKAHMLKSLTVDGGNVLYDKRTNLSQPLKLALLNLDGEKTQLVIDTESGQVIDYKKTFFSTWRGIFKKVSQSVDKMLRDFENERVVRRKYLTVTNN